MRQSSRKRKFKVQVISKLALIRLSILFVTLLILVVWLWSTMVWMPGKSYRGELPALKQEEIRLKSLLRQDIDKIAGDIGARNASKYEH